MITSFAELIDQWPSIAAFAADVGVPYETANSWKKRNSIPANRWSAVIAAATSRRGVSITLERLTFLAQERREAAE